MGKWLLFGAGIFWSAAMTGAPFVVPFVPWVGAAIFSAGLIGFLVCIGWAAWRALMSKKVIIKDNQMIESATGTVFASIEGADDLDVSGNYSDADEFLRANARSSRVRDNVHSPKSPGRRPGTAGAQREERPQEKPEAEPKEKRRTYFAGWRPSPAEDKED